jgi:RNA polymerase sigma-70 factor (ECF subfamily)
MESINEQDLLAGAQAFNMEALSVIYDTFSPVLFTYSQRLLGNASLSEECVAETFSRFLQALKKGRGPTTHLRAYLYRIAHNWVTDYYRRSHPDQPGEEELDLIQGESDDPVDEDSATSNQEVRSALLRLPEQQRQVITLRYLEGWSHEEIAASLGKSVNAIKVIQHRAVRALQRKLVRKTGENELIG